MQNLKTPQGTVKKGIASFKLSTNQMLVAVGTDYNLFESVTSNTSANIIRLSSTQCKLLKGITYLIKVGINGNGFSDTTLGHQWWNIYNVTNSNILDGASAISLPINFVNSWAPLPYMEKYFMPTVDTIISIRGTGGSGTFSLERESCYVHIEEVEYNLIPTDPTKYVETINLTSATGTYTIPSGLPIGTKKLIRKVNSTQGTYTINCTGETFTASALASITLNSDGDFWLVEKINNNRWDLIDGVESGSNTNGAYYRTYSGDQYMYTDSIGFAGSGTGLRTSVWTYPKPLLYDLRDVRCSVLDYFSVGFFKGITSYTTTSITLGVMSENSNNGGLNCSASCRGRWY